MWPFVAMFVSASFFTSASYFSSFFFFIYGYLISVYYYSPDRFERFRNKISVGNLRKTRKKAKKTGKNMTASSCSLRRNSTKENDENFMTEDATQSVY